MTGCFIHLGEREHMLHLDWDDDEVTKPRVDDAESHEREPLLPPLVGSFNPRIRIIGLPPPAGAHLGPVAHAGPLREVMWNDADKTAELPRVLLPATRPLPPRRRAPLELLDDELIEVETKADSQVAIAPIVDLSAPAEPTLDAEVEPETEDEPATSPAAEGISEVRGVGPRLVAVAPLDDSDGDSQRTREPDAAPPSIPSWEDDDDMTLPQRFSDLRLRAQALADAWERARPTSNATAADAPAASPASELASAPASEPRPMGDTIVDADPPSAVRELSLLSEPFADTDPASVEIDVAELAGVASLAQLYADDEPSFTPPPRAQRSSHRPSSFGSVAPVAMSAAPPPRRRAGIVAVVLAAVACCAVFALWAYPQRGALSIRLRTRDGSPAAKAEIFVDGQKRCDTDPCAVRDLRPGAASVKVIVPGLETPQIADIDVRSGEEQVVWIDLPAPQSSSASSPHAAATVVLEAAPSEAQAAPSQAAPPEAATPQAASSPVRRRARRAAPPPEVAPPDVEPDFDPYADE
jgi:hypothetical protein